MYSQTFKNSLGFLKENWLFSIAVLAIYFLLNTVVLYLPLNIWFNIILLLLIMPLEAGLVNCFESCKYEQKKDIKKLFYFYTNFKLLYKSVIIAFFYDSFILATIYIAGVSSILSKLKLEEMALEKTLFLIPIKSVLLIILLIVQLYLFLSAYILVKNPEWSLGRILKHSFKGIKGNINSLFWLQVIFGFSTRWIEIPNKIENIWNICFSVAFLFLVFFINKIFFYHFADLILSGEVKENNGTYGI